MVRRRHALFFFFALVGLFGSASARAAVFSPTSFTLSNGLQIIVVPNPIAPVVSQMVWYKVGSSDEKRGEYGLAHYLEHLMFRGTTTIPPGDFSKMIAAQGGEDNAFTSYDYTSYFEEVAADRLPMIMQMEADRMHNLKIMAETALPELQVVLDERQQRTDNNPEGRFIEKLDHHFMPHHPYGRPVIGWKKGIEKFTALDAQKFYKAHYAPNNAVVVISGAVKVEDVMRLAAAIYGPLPRRSIEQRPPLPPAPLPKTTRLVETDAGIDQPQLIWRLSAPSYATQKGSEAYAYEVLAEALDGGDSGVLYQKLAMTKGLASLIETSYDPDARGGTSFTIAASPQPGKSPELLEQALRQEIAARAATGLEAEVVERAKKRLERSALFAREGLLFPGYAFGMAVTTGHKVSDVESWPERIRAVTVDQVNTALRDLASTQHQTLGLLLPDPHAPPPPRESQPPSLHQGTGVR